MPIEDIYIKKFLDNSNPIDKFFVYKKFTSNESVIIKNPIYILYFDVYGNITVKIGTEIKLEYRNPLSEERLYYLDTYIYPYIDRINKKFIFSPNLIWILYNNPDDNCFYLMYNFIHTVHFRKFYLINQNEAIGIFKSYCNLVSTDDTCSCISTNGELCIKRLLTTENISQQKNTANYPELLNNCQYVEKGCGKYKDIDDSFLKNYYDSNPWPDSINLNMCSVVFSAGENINVKSDVQQQCSQQFAGTNMNDNHLPNPTGTTLTPPTPTINNDYEQSTGSIPTKKPNIPTQIQEKTMIDNVLKYGGIIVLLILIGVGIKYFTDKNDNHSPNTPK